MELTPRRRAYANGMEWGLRIGLAGLGVTYVLYLLGIVPPHVGIPDLVAHWHLSAPRMIEACHLYTGRSWLLAVREGDYLSLVVIAFLASVSIACCIRIIPFLARDRDLPMLLITAAQIAVLLLAASGLVSGGL